MKYGVYSIYDAAGGIFTAPTIDVSDASAVRAFQQAMENEASIMHFKPSDFSFYQVGTFDVESGAIESVIPPKRLLAGDSGSVEKE